MSETLMPRLAALSPDALAWLTTGGSDWACVGCCRFLYDTRSRCVWIQRSIGTELWRLPDTAPTAMRACEIMDEYVRVEEAARSDDTEIVRLTGEAAILEAERRGGWLCFLTGAGTARDIPISEAKHLLSLDNPDPSKRHPRGCVVDFPAGATGWTERWMRSEFIFLDITVRARPALVMNAIGMMVRPCECPNGHGGDAGWYPCFAVWDATCHWELAYVPAVDAWLCPGCAAHCTEDQAHPRQCPGCGSPGIHREGPDDSGRIRYMCRSGCDWVGDWIVPKGGSDA